MREILFRGQDAITGEWLEGYFVQQKNNIGGIHSCIFQNFADENRWEMKMVGLNTVCQYTGLTDKNGRKIFEGDIIKTNSGRLCKVVWFSSPQYQGWDLIPIETKNPAPEARRIWEDIECIGNIFDNPELLIDQPEE